MTSLNAFPFSAVKKSGLALALSVAAFCAQVDWRKFDSGSSVLRALA